MGAWGDGRGHRSPSHSQGRKQVKRSSCSDTWHSSLQCLLSLGPSCPYRALEDSAAPGPRGAKNKGRGSGRPGGDQQPNGHKPGVEPSMPAHCWVGGRQDKDVTRAQTSHVVNKKGIRLTPAQPEGRLPLPFKATMQKEPPSLGGNKVGV